MPMPGVSEDKFKKKTQIQICSTLWCTHAFNYISPDWWFVSAITSEINPSWMRGRGRDQTLTSVGCFRRFLSPSVSSLRRRPWNIYPLREVFCRPSTLDALEKNIILKGAKMAQSHANDMLKMGCGEVVVEEEGGGWREEGGTSQ